MLLLEDLVRAWEGSEFADLPKERLSEMAIELPEDLRDHVSSTSNGTGDRLQGAKVVCKPLGDCPPASQGVLDELVGHGVQRRIGPCSFQGSGSRIHRESTEGWGSRPRPGERTAEG